MLGGTVNQRTNQQDYSMRSAVGSQWGGEQVLHAPSLERAREVEETVSRQEGERVIQETTTRTVYDEIPLAGTDIDVDLALEHRQKGLMWYPTYRSRLSSLYQVINDTDEAQSYHFIYRFPQESSVFDSLRFTVGDELVEDAAVTENRMTHSFELEAGEQTEISVAYGSQGVSSWKYIFGNQTTQIRDFALSMTTDFAEIDFPEGTLSPTTKTEKDGGWQLSWDYGTLVADSGVGMMFPQKLNPGPWVSRVTFFAPVSLFLFFFVLFVVTLLKGVRLHPMHYFFLGCSFFAFHLLLAYLVDHISVTVALGVASAVSLCLVISYMRLVAGLRFALVEVGIAQLVYLVLFAYTFFLQGFTGLAITGMSVATLFVVMQATGRMDWEQLLADSGKGKLNHGRGKQRTQLSTSP